ncbi:MAG: sortase [Parcubacteria group bacterium]
MSEFFSKIKQYAKRVALLGSLSLVVFSIAFFLVNMNIDPVREISPETASIKEAEANAEFKKRIGSNDIAFAWFPDWAKINNLAADNVYDADPDGDGLPNYLEYIHGTNPNLADTDGDGFSDKQEINNGYDPDAPGDVKTSVFVRIDKIGVEAPMVWSQSTDEDSMLADLERGLGHFYQTASPGQIGNAVISGHSSNYIWAKGDYNHIFKNLNNLEKGDAITVKTMQKNGRIVSYHFSVGDKFTAAPDDERIFSATPGRTLTLSTCWPLGTNFQRLIIKAELVK